MEMCRGWHYNTAGWGATCDAGISGWYSGCDPAVPPMIQLPVPGKATDDDANTWASSIYMWDPDGVA